MSAAPGLSNALFTDLYELTMAQAYWRSGVTGMATFSLFFRKLPPGRGFLVFAGLETIVEHLEGFRFTEEDIHHLESLERFDRRFLRQLRNLRFTGQLRAMPEGTPVFVDEPMLEVQAPIIEAQLVETFLLNQANLHTMLATKAARVVHAARGRSVVDFAARRTQGLDAATAVARCGYIAGYSGTSNVQAAGRFGIPAVGTMAHSFIMSFEHEVDAFRAYAHTFPEETTLLVDTYDTLSGVRNAIEVAREMRAKGKSMRAVRLDSGDLRELARASRTLLDGAGFGEVQILASGGLDEYEIDQLCRDGVPIDGFGVGTRAGVSADAPYIDSAYKLVEYEGRPVLKLSTSKVSLPGCKQVYRLSDASGHCERDVIARVDEDVAGGRPLLVEVMRGGQAVVDQPTLADIRSFVASELGKLPDEVKDLEAPREYPVEISVGLAGLMKDVTSEVRTRELGE